MNEKKKWPGRLCATVEDDSPPAAALLAAENERLKKDLAEAQAKNERLVKLLRHAEAARVTPERVEAAVKETMRMIEQWGCKESVVRRGLLELFGPDEDEDAK